LGEERPAQILTVVERQVGKSTVCGNGLLNLRNLPTEMFFMNEFSQLCFLGYFNKSWSKVPT